MRRPLYRLPQIVRAPEGSLVFLVEGEKDADRLAALSLISTTCAGGAGKWRSEYAKPLAGRRVATVPDNDEPGRDHAAAVLEALRAARVECAVIELDGLPRKGDVSDWLAAGGDAETLTRLAEAALAEASAAEAPRLPTAFVWRDPASLAPRPWLYGRHLLRRQVSLTVAPGGVGKSSMTSVEAIAMAAGRQLLGEWNAGPLNVWLYNLEDPRDELERRIIAAMQHHGIAREEVEGRLYVDTGRERTLTTAVQTREGVTILHPIMDALADELAARTIDVLVIDPFVSSHQVSENDNGAIDLVAKEWGRLAERCNCAIELVHHSRKLNGETGTTESGRGATALLAAARSGRVLNKMSEELKGEAGVQDDPATYFAVSRDKANLAPAGKREWRRVASVLLSNGDSVGVVEQWQWRDAFDGVSPELASAARRAVMARETPPRESSQAKDWVGHVVGEVLGIDTDEKGGKARVAAIIKAWIKSDVLRVEKVADKRNGREAPVVVAGDNDPAELDE